MPVITMVRKNRVFVREMSGQACPDDLLSNTGMKCATDLALLHEFEKCFLHRANSNCSLDKVIT